VGIGKTTLKDSDLTVLPYFLSIELIAPTLHNILYFGSELMFSTFIDRYKWKKH
jgi:hypothetical protein